MRSLKKVLATISGLFLFTAGESVFAAESISYAYLKDPAQEALIYAIKAGKIKSDKITIDLKALTVPSLTQATTTKQFDVIQTSALAVPDAATRGLDLKIIGIGQKLVPNGEGMALWTTAESSIKSIQDLKGKSLGVTGLKSMGTTMIRLALLKRYGFNVSLAGGDVKLVEMPSPNLPAALSQHRIEATNLIPTQAFQVRSDPNFKKFGDLSGDIKALIGSDVVYSVLVSYPDRLKARPEAFKEFIRIMKASLDYTQANRAEVFRAVSKETGMPVEYFEAWFDHYISFPVIVGQKDIVSLEKIWSFSKELGVISSYPSGVAAVWQGVLSQ
ncbi:hypothetical protein CNE_BB1p12500 (plasmid) [Cupriavidus necator N-1]|uniref:SsuA/THI5-like domain-containing protein n=1 Tax=Cupriavidus necator (strain ATCC 43291 / DSM 13513 / CCUG 52238 / LMG 8453 / N-1) TaxID=1042878 RepID=F8GVM9_CUPNN|nr:MqnA/MqnD/SBP family protein [Cupriavidus necator]AEI82649.1 hypothetical protein CNE_BB1p12500 [Cupriavidus necator N-1]MDX6007644.1 MqnA/MqnD/SBP family protein [Cupriavidus necator]